jgi:hypothetical protein
MPGLLVSLHITAARNRAIAKADSAFPAVMLIRPVAVPSSLSAHPLKTGVCFEIEAVFVVIARFSQRKLASSRSSQIAIVRFQAVGIFSARDVDGSRFPAHADISKGDSHVADLLASAVRIVVVSAASRKPDSSPKNQEHDKSLDDVNVYHGNIRVYVFCRTP